MQGWLAGWLANAVWASRIRIAICSMPLTSASCEKGIGSRERRVFTLGAVDGAIVGSLARRDCMAAITPWRPSSRRAPVGFPKEARRGSAGAVERSSAWEAGTGCSWELWSLPGDAAVIVSAQARHSGSFTHQVSAGAIMSTRSLMTRFRNVVGSRSSPRQGSAITVISAPCPFWVWLPGVIETGIRTRLSE